MHKYGIADNKIYTGVFGNFRLVGEDGDFSVDSVSAIGIMKGSQRRDFTVNLVFFKYTKGTGIFRITI